MVHGKFRLLQYMTDYSFLIGRLPWKSHLIQIYIIPINSLKGASKTIRTQITIHSRTHSRVSPVCISLIA